MERRKFVIGAGALATGSAAAVGTGAFSSVTADRETTIDIAGDEDAFLALSVEDTEYARIDENDLLVLEFTGEADDGEGINKAATTRFDDVISVENQGSEEVDIWFVSDERDVDAGRADRTRVFDEGDTDLTEPQNTLTLGTGASEDLSVEFETKEGTRVGRFESPKRVRADVDGPDSDDDYEAEIRDEEDPFDGNPFED